LLKENIKKEEEKNQAKLQLAKNITTNIIIFFAIVKQWKFRNQKS